MEQQGFIERIGDVEVIPYSDKQTGEEKTFEKRAFVLRIVEEYNGKEYENFCEFEAGTDASKQALDGLAVGEEVVCQFSLKGREYKGKDNKLQYFNSLKCFNVKKLEAPVTANSGSFPQAEGTGADIPF